MLKADIETDVEDGHVDMGGTAGGMNWEMEIDIYTLRCIK